MLEYVCTHFCSALSLYYVILMQSKLVSNCILKNITLHEGLHTLLDLILYIFGQENIKVL